MTDTVIRVENLGKRYQIGETKAAYSMLGESLVAALKTPFRRRGSDRTGASEFWALRDISFEVQQGQILGIIGRNGAGKSTLLKILSRITEPTIGCVRMRGRVRALLEVGTGFHPELTGRENVYLNGAILGMKRAEISRKFDEIVEFAEIQQFLDTPVKRYSSGMYTRLAFSIAAHLEPEILIVDEVLAVGDAAFQQKCLGKMNAVAREGRTVLFVSHNMGVVQTLCTRALLLRNGTIATDGTSSVVVGTYLEFLEKTATQDVAERTERRGKGNIRIARVEISSSETEAGTVLATGRPARFVFDVSDVRSGMSCSFTIYDNLGQPVTAFDSAIHGREDITDPTKGAKFLCDINELPLLPGRYRINVAIMHNGEVQDHLEAAAFMNVEQGQLRGRPAPRESGYGSVGIPHRWTLPR